MFCFIKPHVRKQIVIGVCLNIGQLIVGSAVGWSAPMLPLLQDLSTTPLPAVVTETQGSLIGSCLLLGCVIGGPLSNISSIVGRKKTIILGGVLTIVSSVILATAKSFTAIIIGRIATGLPTMLITTVNIMYIGEIASTDLRGLILTSTGVFHTLGILLAYSVGPFVTFSQMGYYGITLGVLHVLAILSIPESPVFYALKGNEEGLKKSLDKLGRIKDLDDVLSYTIDQSTKNIETKSAWIDLFTIKNNRKALLITVTLSCFQLGGGIMAVSFFATNIFEAAGSSVEPNLATIVIGATTFSGALVAPMFVEKFGRKILLMFSCALCCIFMVVLGWYFYLVSIDSPLVSSLGWLPLASLVISVFGFGVGLNIIPNTILGELYSPKVRSIGSSVTLTIGSLCGFVVSSSFGYMVNEIGSHGTFWTFSFLNAVAFVFTIVCVPETKGKTLQEIETMLKK